MNSFAKYLKEAMSDFMALLYPDPCPGCHDILESNEEIICTRCRVQLPKTQFLPHTENQIEKLFWGKANIEKATAFLQFHKSSIVKNLMHELKYRGNEQVGELLGRLCAAEYAGQGFFEGIDLIIPVPLHVSKLRQRGYNQCTSICKGISELTATPVEFNGLIRNRANATQTKKSRFARWQNTKDLFSVNGSHLRGKHVLLVDDVVTTGSTLESCAKTLSAHGNLVSIMAIACPID